MLSSQVDELAALLLKRLDSLNGVESSSSRSASHQRLLVGLAGSPGASRSLGIPEQGRSGQELARLEGGRCDQQSKTLRPSGRTRRLALQPRPARCVRRACCNAAKLSSQHPKEAHRRRGAAFTFDAEAYTAWLRQLRTGSPAAPAFKHEVKDPEADAIVVEDAHRIVIVEGNYVLRSDERWAAATAMLDERWLLVTPVETVKRRLIARHVASGICADEATARDRVETSDLLNWDETIPLNATPTLVIEDVDLAIPS